MILNVSVKIVKLFQHAIRQNGCRIQISAKCWLKFQIYKTKISRDSLALIVFRCDPWKLYGYLFLTPFTESAISENVFPACLKTAGKTRVKSDCTNHRSVTLLPNFSKIFEKKNQKTFDCFAGKEQIIVKRAKRLLEKPN